MKMNSGKSIHEPQGGADRVRDSAIVHARLAAIVRDSQDAIVAKDLEGIVTDWNEGAESLFGYPAEEMIGKSIRKIIPESRMHEEESLLARIRQGLKVETFETERVRKDGRLIHVSVTASPIRDALGGVVGVSKIARDITFQKEQNAEFERLTRLYAALSQINQSIVMASSRQDLFDKVCKVLVEFGGFQMAWVGRMDEGTRRILPVATGGQGVDYLKDVEIFADDQVKGRGPTGRAYRLGQPSICNDMLHNPTTQVWRSELERFGFSSSASFPIRQIGTVCGTLTVYSSDPWYFRDQEINLLEEAAGDISFALEAFAERERREISERMAESERQFSKTMIESLPGILYFYDDTGRFIRWNRNFEMISGYSAAEISGMHPLDFIEEKDREMVRQRIMRVFETGDASAEASFCSKNGSSTPYFFTGHRILFEGRPCLVGVGVDISERKRMESALQQSELKYRELVELANSIIVRWNIRGEITFINEFGQRFFGYSAAELLGRNVMGTLVPIRESTGRDLESLMKNICADPAAFQQNTNENIRRDGSRVWISWTNRIIQGERREITEILSVGTDITQQRQAEQALRVLNQTLEMEVAERTRELQSALQKAESADQLKSAFLATMSHELRTPLNSIIGFTGILLQGLAGSLNDEQTKQLGMVSNSARHLLELINDVLDISKIEAGQLEVRLAPFNLAQSLERVLALIRPLAERKHLELRVQFAQAPAEMFSDQRRFEQVLINLLSNAVKFTDHGNVTLQSEMLSHWTPPGRSFTLQALRIRVSDTGIGMKQEELKNLFLPFHQLDSGTTRQFEGTGLGLAISRRLVELLGGEISVASQWSIGSEFTVVLPCQPHFQK